MTLEGGEALERPIGVLGGGQLGRMLALAGRPLGATFRFLEPAPLPPVRNLGEVVEAPFDALTTDPGLAAGFSEGLEVVTYEFENVPVAAAHAVQARVPVHPSPQALRVAQDRALEKAAFAALGIPVAPYRTVGSRAELEQAVAEVGLPAVLKTRSLGYDGKGQAVLRSHADLDSAWEALGGTPLLLEAFVSFRRELSCLMVRGENGEVRGWPLVENVHRAGILRVSRAPAAEAPEAEAQAYVARLLEHLSYVGVLAVEFFDTGSGLLANEMAPRVHNTGHWTQDGAETCQFENHVRAILGLPLGATGLREGFAGMVNLIGGIPPRAALLRHPGVHLHLYDKAPRPGRKVGHVNIVARSQEALDARMDAVLAEVAKVEQG
jgi:5-(carboxyamino)imidazole ribonucleotide synthase